jgi:hypothetical protein
LECTSGSGVTSVPSYLVTLTLPST